MVDGDFKSNNQTVILETSGKRAEIPRSVTLVVDKSVSVNKPGISVSADPDCPQSPTPCETINIHVGDYYNDPDLDRGLARVIVRDPNNPTIGFSLKPQYYDDEKLQKIFGRVFGRVMQVLTSALEGNIPPPPY